MAMNVLAETIEAEKSGSSAVKLYSAVLAERRVQSIYRGSGIGFRRERSQQDDDECEESERKPGRSREFFHLPLRASTR